MTSHPRTELEELPVDECWALLGRRTVGRLAVAVKNHPDIFPVNYRVADETIVVRTAPGLKLAAATLGSAVAFEVDALDEAHHTGWSVVVRGLARELSDMAEVFEAERLQIEPWAKGDRDRYFRISPTRVTGRRIPRW